MSTSRNLVVVTLVAVVTVATEAVPAAQTPVGTAFTYQGRLTDAGSSANGAYDFQFTLYDAPAGGNPIGSAVLRDDVPVSGGVFTELIDFGAAAFNGDARWLEVAVRPGASTSGYATIAPRHRLSPTPYALEALRFGGKVPADYALEAEVAAALSGYVTQAALDALEAEVAKLSATQTFTGTNTFSNAANAFTGSVKVAGSVAACDSSGGGSLRYNVLSQLMEMCDGTSWTAIALRRTETVTSTLATPCSTSQFTNTGLAVGTPGELYPAPSLIVVYLPTTTSPAPGTVTFRLVHNGGAELGRNRVIYGSGNAADMPLNWALPLIGSSGTYPIRLECIADQAGAGISIGQARMMVIPQ